MSNPKVDILVGGQWGSEGKGAVAAYIAKDYNVLVRGGAPNAGHTFWDGDKLIVLNTLPCGAFTNPEASIVIASGSIVSLEGLAHELEMLYAHNSLCYPGSDRQRIFIDKEVTVLDAWHVRGEAESGLVESIGSTAHGCGAAMIDKIGRLASRDNCL